jgi:hypothetical protein
VLHNLLKEKLCFEKIIIYQAFSIFKKGKSIGQRPNIRIIKIPSTIFLRGFLFISIRLET